VDNRPEVINTSTKRYVPGVGHSPYAPNLESTVDATAEELTQLTHFSRIGGAPAVDRLVEAFYTRVDSLLEARTIRAMHPPDLSETKDVLKRYLGEWMGGPTLYSRERGHPRLRSRHIGFKIGEAERDAWLLCMRDALDEVVADTALRDDLFQAFFKLADWMRNQPGNPHDVRTASSSTPSF
jgi:hemoglobin